MLKAGLNANKSIKPTNQPETHHLPPHPSHSTKNQPIERRTYQLTNLKPSAYPPIHPFIHQQPMNETTK